MVPEARRDKKLGPDRGERSQFMQTPSSEEMHSHSHFPTWEASEKRSEMRPAATAGRAGGREGWLWIPPFPP